MNREAAIMWTNCFSLAATAAMTVGLYVYGAGYFSLVGLTPLFGVTVWTSKEKGG